MSQKYNIAIIAGQLVVGGAERQLYLLLSHLDREKFQPVVLTLHPGHGDYWENAIESLDIPLLRIPHRHSRVVRLLDIVRVLRPYKPQLIHGWHLFSSPYAGVAAKILGAKSMGSLRGSYRAFRNSPQEKILLLHLVDAIFVNSYSTGNKLRAAQKRKRQNIYVVQNAVEDPNNDRLVMREKLSQYFGISPAGMWIGSLGRLYPMKHFDLLLNVLTLLRDDVKDFHFLLIGDGPERSRLERMAGVLGLSQHVTFAGEIPSANAWLSALDIFCFTSLDEGLPNVIMEAAVAGVPVVAWRVPFIEELLEAGSMALLVEPKNIGDFKEALLNLIRSPELRIKIGKAGRDHVIENFSTFRYVQRMVNIYEGCLSIKPKPSFEES